jgi:hypothetical protein
LADASVLLGLKEFVRQHAGWERGRFLVAAASEIESNTAINQ